jgi:GMP synthase (glutamine-hydrolysing)
VIAQHAPHEGPGLLTDVLIEAGVDAQIRRVDLGDDLPDPHGFAAVVTMGGAMGVHDDHPWLATERTWLATAARAGVPVLGVCLGAQQLAAALGARVTTGPAPEIGLGSVELTDEGRADPVLGPEDHRLLVVHWHGDAFDIPEGAVRLASSERFANQAFRLGDLAYGLQFHLEVDDAMAELWAPELPTGVRIDGPGLGAVQKVGRRVLGRFVDLVLALGR